MARGHLYELQRDIDHLCAAEDDFYRLVEIEFDYIETVENEAKLLTDFFAELGMCIGQVKHSDKEKPIYWVDITDEGKRNYFRSQYETFMQQIKNLTLDEFINSSTVWNLQYSLEDTYGDAVTTQYDQFISFDRFMREAEPGRYYIGATFYMH